MGTITKKNKRFIAKNYGKMSTDEISAATGMPPANIRKAARRMNLVHSTFWREDEIRILKELGSKKSCEELAKILHRSAGAIQKKRSCMGIYLDEETKSKIFIAKKASLCSSEARRRGAEKLKETYKKEKMRKMYGLPLRTNLHIALESLKTRRNTSRARSNLRRLGYIIQRNDSNVFYNDTTKRNERLEARYAEKHGFSFLREGDTPCEVHACYQPPSSDIVFT